MKKVIISVFILLLYSMSVSALDIDVDCKDGWWDTDICRQHELDDEFDQVEDAVNDNTAELDRQKKVDKTQNKKINKNKNAIEKAKETVVDLRENVDMRFDKLDVPGISRKLYYMFFGDAFFEHEGTILDYLKTVFTTKDEAEEIHLRIDALEAVIVDEFPGCITASRHGQNYYEDNCVYRPATQFEGCTRVCSN